MRNHLAHAAGCAIPLDAPFVAVWLQPRHLVLRVQVEQDQRGIVWNFPQIYYGVPTLLSPYPIQEFREGAYSPRIRLATPGLVSAALGVVWSDSVGYYVRSQPCSPHWRRESAFTPEEEDEEAMDADEGRYAWNGCSRGSRGGYVRRGPGDLGILVETRIYRAVDVTVDMHLLGHFGDNEVNQVMVLMASRYNLPKQRPSFVYGDQQLMRGLGS
ncbi:hypothetical protein EDB83DRAFT_2437082 [Lactarius deliciosus]|nr:hypothetical protein EDB83DRAFT_2437082 [Lactarius deliciosus]